MLKKWTHLFLSSVLGAASILAPSAVFAQPSSYRDAPGTAIRCLGAKVQKTRSGDFEITAMTRESALRKVYRWNKAAEAWDEESTSLGEGDVIAKANNARASSIEVLQKVCASRDESVKLAISTADGEKVWVKVNLR